MNSLSTSIAFKEKYLPMKFSLHKEDLKYLTVLSIPIAVFCSLHFNGINSYIIPLGNFLVIPVLDLLFPEIKTNPNRAEEQRLKINPFFDWILYLNVLCQIALLFYTVYLVTYTSLSTADTIGKIWSMGICSAVLGINTAHELGHRKEKFSIFVAKLDLMTTSYMHFYIEHNRGHHHYVATRLDPATAHKNQTVYAFYFQSIIGSYLSAWKLANRKMQKQYQRAFVWQNEMIQFTLIQIAFYALIFTLFGLKGILCLMATSIIGILVLETINYIEHYGLERKVLSNGNYEKVQPWHSWNSDHLLGRIMLLELTRHSDHHYKASKRFPTLKSINTSPQLPFGYPGSMVISWFPPLWFKIMNPLLKEIETKSTVLQEGDHPIASQEMSQIEIGPDVNLSKRMDPLEISAEEI